ncbi:MAG: sulfatase-like hydrolase/transferase [Planctomycetaceae bacterium]|jgi:arylsulfatase A-like enzyme|nr:sulfatase-like hydrolase/transferase [Planctomycetaceae bacterium]
MKQLFILIVVLLTLSVVCNTVVSAESRPNFLFIYSDDQSYDQFGVVQREQGEKGRYPWFQTPNMDRLAENGVRFRNAFVTSSLCAPSRAAFLTGRYNHCNGVASNSRPLPVDSVTHASLLQKNGYTTAYFGKWHMDSQKERPGFDYHASFVGQGRFIDCPLLVQGIETPTKGWVDDVTTDYAIKFIETQKGTGKPWSVVLGFKAPHGPATPPERNAKLYEGEQARVVPNLNVQAIYLEKQGIPFGKQPLPENGLVPVSLDKFRCVKSCDDNLGRLLDTLDRLNEADNTVVIYCSDNGYYFGEHGLGDKRSAYEESLRIPFVVRFPKAIAKGNGIVVDEPILNIDLAPTLLDFAGVAIPKEMQGRSFRPLIEGKKPANWRKGWFYEYFAEKQRNSKVVDVTAVRTLNAKLIRYSLKNGIQEDWSELFDLQNDPYELKNLYNDPAYADLRKNLKQEYDRLKKEIDYKIPDYVDRPEWWDTGLPVDENRVLEISDPGFRLIFDFKTDNGTKINDSSGKENHGISHGTVLDQGENNQPARRFDGKSFIDIKKSPALNVAKIPWTTEIVFKPESPDGVLIGLGGPSQGYTLGLEDGRLIFTAVVDGESYKIATKNKVEGWNKVTALFTANRTMALYLGKRKVGEKKLPSLIPKDPNFAWRIGSSSDKETNGTGFVGLISSVQLSAGEVTPQ